MSSEKNNDDELDEAFRRFGKQLKEREVERAPTKDEKLRERVEKIDSEASQQSGLFAGTEETLHRLKKEFQIVVQTPKNLDELLIYLLTRKHAHEQARSTITAADLYTKLHETPDFSSVSPKAFRKALSKLEKKQILSLHESEGVLTIRLRQEFLSNDEAGLLDIAARKGGAISLEAAMLATRWPLARVRTAIEALLAKKMISEKRGFVHGTRFEVTE
ncbi:MAG: hypothetical protein ACFFDP_04895 [Promethearchaeota archaeon]